MTRIKRIYTDPCASASSVQSVFYRINNKPQMNADERRYIPVTEFVAQSHRSIYRKGREERKAEGQESLRSLHLIEFHGFPTAQGNKEMVVFQTGLTGSTGCVISFDHVHPAIMEASSK